MNFRMIQRMGSVLILDRPDGAFVRFIPRRPDGAIGRKRSRNGPRGSEEVGG